MAARTNCHESGGLKQKTFILSQSWRLKTENQGAGRATLSSQTPEKNHSLPLPASGAGGSTWLVAASLQSLPRLRLAPFLVCVYVSPPLLKGTWVIGFGAQPNAVQLIWIHYLCLQRPQLQIRYNLRFQIGMNFGATVYKHFSTVHFCGSFFLDSSDFNLP